MSEIIKDNQSDIFDDNSIIVENNLENTEELPFLDKEEQKVKKAKKNNKKALFVLLAIIVVTPFMIFSFLDDSMDKGFFQIFDLTSGDKGLDDDLACEFYIKMYSWFEPWKENVTDFYMIKDYEKPTVYRMFDADSDTELLKNIVKYYELPEPTSNSNNGVSNGVCRFKDSDSLNDSISELLGTNLDIKDAYVIHYVCTLDNGGYEGDFFFYKVGEDWNVMPYLDPLKSAIDGVKKY